MTQHPAQPSRLWCADRLPCAWPPPTPCLSTTCRFKARSPVLMVTTTESSSRLWPSGEHALCNLRVDGPFASMRRFPAALVQTRAASVAPVTNGRAYHGETLPHDRRMTRVPVLSPTPQRTTSAR
jgi:hypothetical protein